MLEAGVIIVNNEPVYWHLPEGRTAGGLPDSRSLWEVFWNLRNEDSLGFAHSHPGYGIPSPSWTDLTTFSGVELGLGRRLDWWITSGNTIILLRHVGPQAYQYNSSLIEDPSWVNQLRLNSQF